MSVKKSSAAISPVMRQVSGYIATALRRPLPAPVVEKTKHHILDTLAAMVSGTKLLPGRMAISYVKTLGGSPQAQVVGTRLLTNAVNAAVANAMLAHADETDDSHAPSLTHPGCGIVAAALAMAERERRDGTALLRAVTLGYDISSRLTISLGGGAFRGVGHLTHCFGPTFGAAAASAALARLNVNRVRHVLSYTAQQTGGLSTYMRDVDHIEKAWDFGGMPARNGVAAATMVAAGCTAVEDVFSGERNFYVAFDESRRIGKYPAPAALARDLGRNFEIMRTNIKRWSVGSPIQAPLDSLLELIRAHNVNADDVEKLVIRVSINGANTVNNREMPDICMQQMCAVMLLDGIVTFESAHDEKRMRNPAVLALRQRIELVGDAELEALIPERHGIAELTLKDGRQLRHHTEAVRGTAQNPMTHAEVDEKCYHLMAPVLGKKRARTLCDTVWALEKIKDARKLRPLLQS
ncbi:MAG TPA: MmgE/PrpD family protein [Burkholderiales bacterium]|jgi:2-methylcitrate dehydratase PrpD|nr:MmgE/PrpD family protein [Burkholderiales bacterium]